MRGGSSEPQVAVKTEPDDRLFRFAGQQQPRHTPADFYFGEEELHETLPYGPILRICTQRSDFRRHAFARAGPNQAQGLPGHPEQQAAQAELEKTYPSMQTNDQYLHLSIPGIYDGQTVGVAVNSKGNLFVYSRSNPQGVARGGKAAMLWEFDQNYKFVKEWGPNNYGESFAHGVRVDKDDNVWSVDEGSGMIVKFNPEGQNVFWLGRTPEAIDYLAVKP